MHNAYKVFYYKGVKAADIDFLLPGGSSLDGTKVTTCHPVSLGYLEETQENASFLFQADCRWAVVPGAGILMLHSSEAHAF